MDLSKIIEDIKLIGYLALTLIIAISMATFLLYGIIQIYKTLG